MTARNDASEITSDTHTHTLSALGRHAESLVLWSSVNSSPTDLSAQLHRALALYRAGKYGESLEGKKTNIHWKVYIHVVVRSIWALLTAVSCCMLCTVYECAVEVAEEGRRSAVLCACAMVAYAQRDIHKCKTFLFKA